MRVGADICRCMSQGKGTQASKARQRGSSREREGAAAVTRVRDGFLQLLSMVELSSAHALEQYRRIWLKNYYLQQQAYELTCVF